MGENRKIYFGFQIRLILVLMGLHSFDRYARQCAWALRESMDSPRKEANMVYSEENRFTKDELEHQEAAELPTRELLLGVSLLGIPLVGLDGVNINVDTKGPGWLISG